MTKPKPKSELKAYRGKQSYLTEEQIAVLSKNPNIIKVTPRQVHIPKPLRIISVVNMLKVVHPLIFSMNKA